MASWQGTPPVRHDLSSASFVAFLALFGYAVSQAFLFGEHRVTGPYWFDHPNYFAPVLLMLGLTAATAVPTRWRPVVVLGTLFALMLTGSRAAVAGWFVALAIAWALDRRWRTAAATGLGVGLIALILVSIAFPQKAWAQRILSPVYAALGVEAQSKNLLLWTEELSNLKHWNLIGVDVDRLAKSPGRHSTWVISRTESIEWARPQQSVQLAPGVPYTLSAVFSGRSDLTPGFIGWAGGVGTSLSFEVGIAGGEALVLRRGGLDTSEARLTELENGLRRLEFTFSLLGTQAKNVAVGISPSLGSVSQLDEVTVSELQLEVGPMATTYMPAIERSSGLGEAIARERIFAIAWKGISEAPFFGHGSEAFASYYSARESGEVIPRHAHNAFLQSAFTGGVFGLFGLICALCVLFAVASPLGRALLTGLTVANLVDSTLLTGVVLYPIAFLIGALSSDSNPN